MNLGRGLGLAGLCAVLALATPFARAPGDTTGLDAGDYYAIQQLNARVLHGLDSAADEGRLFADAFTVDGLYIDEHRTTHQGRDALIAAALDDPDQVKGPTNVRHFGTDLLTEPTPEGARGTSAVMVVTGGTVRERSAVTLLGHYQDDLVRSPDGWRIARRVFTAGGAAPPQATHAVTSSPIAASAPGDGSRMPSLTVEDYAEITQLYTRYTFTWDGALDDGRDWIALFTPDGSHTNETSTPKQFFFGPEELLGFARAMKARGNRVPETVGHFITNVMINPTPEGAAVKAYRLNVRLADIGQPNSLGPSGIYFDYLVKTADGWRYRRKNFMAANSAVPETATIPSPPER